MFIEEAKMSKIFLSDDNLSLLNKRTDAVLNKIYNVDCLEGMKYIPDKSIDMILCDLPYGTTQNKWDSIIPLDKLWKEYDRIISTR